MRNLQRMEKLSSATALGLWAEGVILALDRVTRLNQEDTADITLLNEAAGVLDLARDRSEKPLEEPMTTKALAAPETALDVAESLAEDRSPEKTQEMLGEVAAVLRKAATHRLGTSNSEAITPAIDFFSAVGRHQLAEGNLVSGYSGGIKSWAAGPMTSSFS